MEFLTKRQVSPVVEETILKSTMPVAVRRSSRRRTIELRMAPDNTIRVLCPDSMTNQQIEQWVQSKSSWIKAKLLANSKHQPIVPPLIRTGESWLYRGHGLTLKIQEAESSEVKLKGDWLVVSTGGLKRDAVADLLRCWYVNRARARLVERTGWFADRLGMRPAQIQIKTYRSMWGRCNTRGQVAYDWRVIVAPDHVLDYLVIHELCHLKHFDHSGSFWSLVESQQPEYNDSRVWLTQHTAFVKSMFTPAI